MPDAKISALVDGTTPDDADDFVVARAGSTLKLTWAALKAAIGGSQPYNSAVIQLAVPPPLTVANFRYDFQTADMTIVSQTGTDFSIGEPSPGSPGILSEAGGVFQTGLYLSCPQDAALDGGSSEQRWIQFQAQTGDFADVLGSLGLDLSVPVYAGEPFLTPDACLASLPGVGVPGGYALRGLAVVIRNSFGTDSVPLDLAFGWPMLGVWRIGT